MQREAGSILCGDVMPVAEDILVHRVFGERASCREDVGVEDVEGFTSCLSLNRLSNAVARRLMEALKVGQRSPSTDEDDVEKLWTIGVDVEPGHRLLVVILAIIKLGLAYVPVDSLSAANRVKYILQVLTGLHGLCIAQPVFWFGSFCYPFNSERAVDYKTELATSDSDGTLDITLLV